MSSSSQMVNEKLGSRDVASVEGFRKTHRGVGIAQWRTAHLASAGLGKARTAGYGTHKQSLLPSIPFTICEHDDVTTTYLASIHCAREDFSELHGRVFYGERKIVA